MNAEMINGEIDFKSLNDKIIKCHRCPRLVEFRETVPIRKLSQGETPWRKPVPGFGDPHAWLLILGLAPSIEGANRTGRSFTGDESGKFLIKTLYLAGLASQPTSSSLHDGLKLNGCYLTASVKCVPPKHHPLREEFSNCNSYFLNELYLLKKLKAVLALGKHAFDTYQGFLKKEKVLKKTQSFAHGAIVNSSGWPTLYAAYHPSPQILTLVN